MVFHGHQLPKETSMHHWVDKEDSEICYELEGKLFARVRLCQPWFFNVISSVDKVLFH